MQLSKFSDSPGSIKNKNTATKLPSEFGFITSWMRSLRKRQVAYSRQRLSDVERHLSAWLNTSNSKFQAMYREERERLMRKISANQEPVYEFTLFPELRVRTYDGYPFCRACADYICGKVKKAWYGLEDGDFIPSEEERFAGCREYVWGAQEPSCQRASDNLDRVIELFATGRCTEQDVKISYIRFVRAHTIFWKNGEWRFATLKEEI